MKVIDLGWRMARLDPKDGGEVELDLRRAWDRARSMCNDGK